MQQKQKKHLKKAKGIYKSNLELKSNLAKLKAEVDKKDVGKLKTVPVDLNKLSNVVNNEVVERAVYDKLVAKVKNIDTSGFVLKKLNTIHTNQIQKRKLMMQTKIFNTSGLVKKQIMMLKLLKQKVKYLALVVQLLLLH